MEKFEDGTGPPPVDLVQCNICERTFLPDVLKKHTNFCQMSKAKKKYVFDSRSQRTRGTVFSVLEPTQPKAEPPKKPSNWRKNNKDLISCVRAAKIFSAAMKDGTSLPPPPPHPYDPDYIQCPYCQWRFKKSAADRHIQICKEQHAQMPNNGTAPLPLDLVQCKICIRRFFPEDREKHEEICQKLLAKRRKVFDSRSPPSGAAHKPQEMSSGFGSARKTNHETILIQTKAEAYISRNNSNIVRNISKYCHLCETRYLGQSTKFFCKYGMRRMCM
uniref:Zinc finger C2HC domain-containing protein 1A n=1 Tax=Gouania willdenowi TaxID=441366 RepID=A0A8C5GJ26_GOUWI